MMEGELRHVSAQSLECPVCLNIFKDPKILSCSHTFCKGCLNNLLKCHGNTELVRCPVCRAETRVLHQDVNRLQTNLALRTLLEDVKNQHQVCTNCRSEDKPKAVVYCQDCGKYLCIACQTKHSQWAGFNDHEVLNMHEITSGKVSIRRYRKCKKHPREDEECFCSDCRRFYCFRCVVMEHKDEGHRVIEASVYESNHLKSVEELKSKTNRKRSRIEKYVDFIDTQKGYVSNVKKRCIDDIRKAYDESVRQLTEKKELLISDICNQTAQVKTELATMKKEAQRQIIQMNTVTDLVGNGTKIPLETEALIAYDTLCQELQDTLTQKDPDYEQPRISSKKGKCIVFEKNPGLDDLRLGRIVKSVVTNVALPTKDSMNIMEPTPDGKMAVALYGGGIGIYSADGQLQQTVLKDIEIYKFGFLSNGQCVVRNSFSNITLFTTEWQKMDVLFETRKDLDSWSGGLGVDIGDNIYVGSLKAKKIQVFSPDGGQAIREIPCERYALGRIIMSHGLIMVTEYDRTITVFHEHGEDSIEYSIDTISKGKHISPTLKRCPYAAVTYNGMILIAYVNHKTGSVSIKEYNRDLQHIRTHISDYRFEKKPGRKWYDLQEFRSGEIAFCTPGRLYIFH